MKINKIKFVFLISIFIFTVLLYLNRFGISLDIIHEHKALYCNDCELRHIFEHFVWAFILPFCFLYASLFLEKIIKTNKKTSNLVFFPYWIVFSFVIVIQIIRIISAESLENKWLEIFRSLFEILGLIMGYFYYAKPIIDSRRNNSKKLGYFNKAC